MPASELRRRATASLAIILVDAEVLANVAQELDAPTGPIVQSRLLTMTAAFGAVEGQERFDLSPQPFDPFATVPGSLSVRSAVGLRVADQTRSAADQAEGTVARAAGGGEA